MNGNRYRAKQGTFFELNSRLRIHNYATNDLPELVGAERTKFL